MANASPFGPLEGFGHDARQVLSAAEAEAERLRHPRIGTEHLLLGLLKDEDAPVAQALRHAGASLAAARHKVDEAVGASGTGPPGEGTTITERASRAVGWAVRLSHQRRSDVVTSSDLLQGVLHVEGTAGQVLRALRIDVDQLIARAEHLPPDPISQVAASGPEPIVRCASCGEEIGARLRHHLVTALAEGGAGREAHVFSCGNCGVVLGVGPA